MRHRLSGDDALLFGDAVFEMEERGPSGEQCVERALYIGREVAGDERDRIYKFIFDRSLERYGPTLKAMEDSGMCKEAAAASVREAVEESVKRHAVIVMGNFVDPKTGAEVGRVCDALSLPSFSVVWGDGAVDRSECQRRKIVVLEGSTDLDAVLRVWMAERGDGIPVGSMMYNIRPPAVGEGSPHSPEVLVAFAESILSSDLNAIREERFLPVVDGPFSPSAQRSLYVSTCRAVGAASLRPWAATMGVDPTVPLVHLCNAVQLARAKDRLQAWGTLAGSLPEIAGGNPYDHDDLLERLSAAVGSQDVYHL